MKRPGGFDRGAGDEAQWETAGRPVDGGARVSPEPESAGGVPSDPIRLIGWGRGAGRAGAETDAADRDRTADPEAPAEPAPDEGRGAGGADGGGTADLATAPLVRLARPRNSIRAAKRDVKRARRSVRDREKREQRRFTAHLRRTRRNWLIVVGAVLGLAVFVAVGVLSPATAVREVRVVGASAVDAEDLRAALARFDGVPLVLVSDAEVHRALEPFPLIQRYAIERIPPHTLLLRIEEREAVIAVAQGERFALRDAAGVLVDTVKKLPSGVPVARGGAIAPGSPGFDAAARVIRDLPRDIRKKLAEVSASSSYDVAFVLKNGTKVGWGDASETQRKAVVLRAMLKSVKSASQIDVSAPDAPVFTQ